MDDEINYDFYGKLDELRALCSQYFSFETSESAFDRHPPMSRSRIDSLRRQLRAWQEEIDSTIQQAKDEMELDLLGTWRHKFDYEFHDLSDEELERKKAAYQRIVTVPPVVERKSDTVWLHLPAELVKTYYGKDGTVEISWFPTVSIMKFYGPKGGNKQEHKVVTSDFIEAIKAVSSTNLDRGREGNYLYIVPNKGNVIFELNGSRDAELATVTVNRNDLLEDWHKYKEACEL